MYREEDNAREYLSQGGFNHMQRGDLKGAINDKFTVQISNKNNISSTIHG